MGDVLVRVPVPEQEPQVRAKNFEEVCLGYTKEQAEEEASRCLNCKNAQCQKGCPVSINIPGFIEKVKSGDIQAAYDVISESVNPRTFIVAISLNLSCTLILVRL